MNTLPRHRFATLAATLLAGAFVCSAAKAQDVNVQLRLITPHIRLPGHLVLPLPPLIVPRVVVSQDDIEEGVGRLRFNAKPLPDLAIQAKAGEPLAALRRFIEEYPGRVLFCAESAGRREVLLRKAGDAFIENTPALKTRVENSKKFDAIRHAVERFHRNPGANHTNDALVEQDGDDKDGAFGEVFGDGVDGGLDEVRTVVDDGEVHAWR